MGPRVRIRFPPAESRQRTRFSADHDRAGWLAISAMGRLKTPASPSGVFTFRACAAYSPATARRAPIVRALDRIAAGAPVRKLPFVELGGDTRVPFPGYRTDHRAPVDLAAIDAHRAAEAAADLERRLDDGVARQARRDRVEISDLGG